MSGMFRLLKADEIECRVQTCNEKGVSLLLYKDARCDMSILDETVGALHWQREHKELKGNIYCGVSILDEHYTQWVTKWDAGAESYTEKEKGEASDSFKRACVNWGIGRELYTAPFIWIKAKDCSKLKENNGKWQCFDKFTVRAIKYVGGNITYLAIEDERHRLVFTYGQQEMTPRKMLIQYCKDNDLDVALVAEEHHLTKESTDEAVMSALEEIRNGQ